MIDPYAEFDALLDQGTPVIPENLPVSGRGPETLELTAATPRTDELAADASDRKAAVETPADSGWWEEPVEACWSEISVLESIHELRAGIRKCSNVVADHAESAEPGAGIADAPHEHDDQATARTHVMLDRFAALEVPEYDVVEPESSADVEAVPRDDHQAAVPSNDLNVSAPTEAEAIQVTTSGADEATTRSAPQTELHSETRTVNVADRFSGLFTRLRRRRRAVAQQVDAVR